MTNRQNIKRTAELAILTAIVVVFQLLGSFIHIGPTNVSLVLVPIVIGAILTGPKGGAFLGFVFGAMTYFAGVFGFDDDNGSGYGRFPYRVGGAVALRTFLVT